jgi:uncharacterized protein YyaL (SSP411 family)
MPAPDDFPMLKLELHAARASLVSMLNDRHDELVRMIDRSFDKAVEHIQQQLDNQVYAALNTVMANAIQTAADIAAEGLADELAKAMSAQVRDIVQRRMTPTKQKR